MLSVRAYHMLAMLWSVHCFAWPRTMDTMETPSKLSSKDDQSLSTLTSNMSTYYRWSLWPSLSLKVSEWFPSNFPIRHWRNRDQRHLFRRTTNVTTGITEHQRPAEIVTKPRMGAPDLINKFKASGNYHPLAVGADDVDVGVESDDLLGYVRDGSMKFGQQLDDSSENVIPEVDDSLPNVPNIDEDAGVSFSTTKISNVQPPTSGKDLDKDIVTTFLHIVESQSMLGDNCTAGTEMNLGEGVVDRYAQERFRLEAEVAVNRANFLTRLWKYAWNTLLDSEYLLYTSVRSMVEFDDDIFAAGNCYDTYAYKDYWLFCPFGYRLPEGPILVKDLAAEYKYLSNTSEWFYRARKSAERVIQNYTSFKLGYTIYSLNGSTHGPREDDEILGVTYEDGKWSKPYFDCGGGNIWMLTYTVPFFGYENGTYVFKGTSGIDIDLRRVDIDQCPQRVGSSALNIFAASDKCKQRTTKCYPIPGLGFRRGSYKCICQDGFYFPVINIEHRFYNGAFIEEEYEKFMTGEDSVYDAEEAFECLPCPEGCETCVDDSPCVVTLDWVLRTSILILSSVVSSALPLVAWFTWKYGNLKVVKAASPVLLRIIIMGAFFVYSTIMVMYAKPSIYTCTLRVWLREMGFSLSYGALMLKTWRISVIFRVRSAKAIKITDMDLIKRLGCIVTGFGVFLAIRTVVAAPQVIVGRTADDLKAYLCSTDWWDHSCTILEMGFLVWGISLCIVVRKAPSEFNESKFISMAIYNEFLLSVFLNISMIFLQSPANPDLLYIIFFCHSQLTITLLLGLIFGSKAYMVLKGQGKDDEGSVFSKPSTAKFVTRPKSQNSAQVAMSSSASTNRAPTDSSGTRFTDSDAHDEFKRLYMQLEILKEKNMRLGNRHLAAKINAMQDAANKEDHRVYAIESHAKRVSIVKTNHTTTTSTLAMVTVGPVMASCTGETSTEQYLWTLNRRTSKEEGEEPCPYQTMVHRSSSSDKFFSEDVVTSQPVVISENGGGGGQVAVPMDFQPIMSDSPNHLTIWPPNMVANKRLDDGNDFSSGSQGISNETDAGSDATVKSAQNSPQTGSDRSSRHRRNRRRRIVINLDDKTRFTDEITV